MKRPILVVLAIATAALATAGLPLGWQVQTPVPTASLRSLSDEELIDRLTSMAVAPAGVPTNRVLAVEKFAPIDSGDEPRAAILDELIARGITMIPALLAHLEDSRPTSLRLDAQALQLNGNSWRKTIVYDYRDHEKASAAALWAGRPHSQAQLTEGAYTVTVGDCCWVALGRIVNRRLYVCGPDFGNGINYSGIFMLLINSPVQAPELAQAARQDWEMVTPAALEEFFAADALGRDAPRGQRKQGDPWIPPINRPGALLRLLYYFPERGAAVVEQLLQRPLQPLAGSFDPNGRSVPEHEQTRFLRSVSAFHWDRLEAIVHELMVSTIAAEREHWAKTSPAERASLYFRELVNACAEHMAGRGHDAELRALLWDQTMDYCREFEANSAAFLEKVQQSMAAQDKESKMPADILALQQRHVLAGTHASLRGSLEKRLSLLVKLGASRADLPTLPPAMQP